MNCSICGEEIRDHISEEYLVGDMHMECYLTKLEEKFDN